MTRPTRGGGAGLWPGTGGARAPARCARSSSTRPFRRPTRASSTACRSSRSAPLVGLIPSVAALLPPSWELRLVDENVGPLRDEDLRWADVVLTGGMLVQEPAIHEILSRARTLGRRTIVGGPACTTSPERFEDADVVLFAGEAEGRC